MTIEERNTKLKHFITCLKCEMSGKVCDDNCPIQYEAGNMGEIIENLEAISKALEQEPVFDRDCEHCSKTYGTLGCCTTVSNKWAYSCKEGQREYFLGKIRAEIEPKCDRINSLASVLPYTAHREIQELLCEIMGLFEPQESEE